MSHLDIIRETKPNRHSGQRVVILHKSGTGREESLGKTQMQYLLEQEVNLRAQEQRQPRVIRKHHPAEDSRSSFELWLVPQRGTRKASKEGRKKTPGGSKRQRSRVGWLGEEKPVGT